MAKTMADAGSFTFMHADHATPPAISDTFLDGVQGVLADAVSPLGAMTLTENEAIRMRGKIWPQLPFDAGAWHSPAGPQSLARQHRKSVPAPAGLGMTLALAARAAAAQG